MLLTQLPRTTKITVVVAATLLLLLGLHVLDSRLPVLERSEQGKSLEDGESSSGTSSSSQWESPPCRTLPGAEDVLVIMRTGATEIKDKLPIHESTTFQCYGENLVIFSDYEETFGGRQVHNVLADMPQKIVNEQPDFKHYRHVQEVGRKGLDVSELSGNISAESGAFGKNENAGWKLDKWKFLPMANRTLEMYPNKKWYLFVEPDSYVVLSNLLQWIQELDPEKPVYYGSEVLIGEDLFGHGGSAFLLSRPALEKGVHVYTSHTDQYHELTSNHWAGDALMGIALKDAGISLTWTWPMLQGGNPYDQIQYEIKKKTKKMWCSPALSYHHLTPEQVPEFWNFEQDWIQSIRDRKPSRWPSLSFWRDDHSSILHHREVFKGFVLPKLASERMDWTNTPKTEHPGTERATMNECRALCNANSTCLQYALGPAGCFTGSEPRIGHAEEGLQSGWMIERINQWMRKLDHCSGNEGWTVK